MIYTEEIRNLTETDEELDDAESELKISEIIHDNTFADMEEDEVLYHVLIDRLHNVYDFRDKTYG